MFVFGPPVVVVVLLVVVVTDVDEFVVIRGRTRVHLGQGGFPLPTPTGATGNRPSTRDRPCTEWGREREEGTGGVGKGDDLGGGKRVGSRPEAPLNHTTPATNRLE